MRKKPATADEEAGVLGSGSWDAYEEMAADVTREAEALDWSEALLPDVADESGHEPPKQRSSSTPGAVDDHR
jgi:hypothetical protein